ncbi:MAG TPA: hypothetical protein DDW49_09125 [Deltaproteobacteria bacterium]|nr:MAG: hypothetical protein A2048_00220 [Deltaproteobacteria bacterium GWA2_45_12]HBF13522.1 hypothetical protein [Deltaproteobacteria bacterium]
MDYFQELPLSTTTLYANFFQQVKTAEAIRDIGDLKGTFTSKTVKSRVYWYLQSNLTGKKRQIYLGPDSKEMQQILLDHQKNNSLKSKDREERERLAAMLVKGGILLPDRTSLKVLLLLSESGIFKAGSVLVGTHAFLAYSALLGIAWKELLRTQDIDIAQDKNLSVALGFKEAAADLPEVLEQAKMGFFPIPLLNNKNPSTSFKIRGRELHLDILTPLWGREKEEPVFLPALNVAAQPLRYLDYLLEDTQECALPHEAGLIVLVPHPARFAWHKLIVAVKRPTSQTAKIKKDILQAAALFDFFLQTKKSDLTSAYKVLKKRGPGWESAIKKGIQILKQADPVLAKKILSIIP